MSDAISAIFRAMADQIDLNKEGGFGGAFVLVPPGEVKSISTLILDSDASPESFWGTLKAKAEIALVELQDAERRKVQGWGR